MLARSGLVLGQGPRVSGSAWPLLTLHFSWGWRREEMLGIVLVGFGRGSLSLGRHVWKSLFLIRAKG